MVENNKPSVTVLYICDEVVGPHLELLRNVCEPKSTSRPHITVRYSRRLSVPAEHLKKMVTHIDLIEPGSFNIEEKAIKSNRVVYIKCMSDELIHMEHKPHFPTSEFHITMYEGKSKVFARRLLRVLKPFNWGFRVPLPRNTSLDTVRIKPYGKPRIRTSRSFSQRLQNLFLEATSEHLSHDLLDRLTDARRLELVSLICSHLHKATAGFEKIAANKFKGGTNNHREVDNNYSNHIHLYLTPPELARDIARFAVANIEPKEAPINFGDPAVGTGVFYSALLQAVPRERIASAIGIDISAEQVAAAEWRWGNKGLKVVKADYLHMEHMSARDLILANPPYLRHRDIPPKYKKIFRERASVVLKKNISARSGLYVYFLVLSHAWMKNEAVAAWLIPTEFMTTDYGAALRHYLTHNVQLIRIHLFSANDIQFENARVSSAVVVFRKRQSQDMKSVELSEGGTLFDPLILHKVTTHDLREKKRWAIPMRAQSPIKTAGPRIDELFNIRRGLATGANAFFIIERKLAASKGLPPEALRPILPKSRGLRSDIIETEADGYPSQFPQYCLLDCGIDEKEISIRFPQLMDYLRSAGSKVRDRTLVKRRQPWYKQEHRPPAPFLCTYMGRMRDNCTSIRFIWNKSQAVATNSYIMLYPNEELLTILKRKPDNSAKLFALLKATAKGISQSGRVYGGGLHKIEPGELKEIRLPSVPVWLKQLGFFPNTEK